LLLLVKNWLGILSALLVKITYKVISDQNQNHMSKNDLKLSSKSLTCEGISNQNHALE